MLKYLGYRSKKPVNSHSRSYHSVPPERSPGETRLKALRMKIRASAQHLNETTLSEIRTSDLYQEVYEWGKQQADAVCRHGITGTADASARNAATAYTICYAVNSLVSFSHHYQSDLPTLSASTAACGTNIEEAFLKQIKPAHRSKLLLKFQESFHANSDQRRAAILSALYPELVSKLSAEKIISATGIAKAMRSSDKPQDLARTLNEAELLTIVDYLNSSTGTFNAVNGAALASAYYGEHLLALPVSLFSAALGSAIEKLCDHPFFARRDIVCYKGIRLTGIDSPFRLATLNGAYANGGLVAFPNVLSASCDPEQSYAKKKFELGYSLECMITMRRAFYADPFHDIETMGEQEILGPANQRFRVTGKSTFKVFDWRGATPEEVDVDRYELRPAM
jgi:hypothetical protein